MNVLEHKLWHWAYQIAKIDINYIRQEVWTQIYGKWEKIPEYKIETENQIQDNNEGFDTLSGNNWI